MSTTTETNTATTTRSVPGLTREEERDLIRAAQGGDRRAADQLARAHDRYLRRTAERYARHVGAEYDDMLSAAYEGFAQAIVRYDFTHETRLLTYASWWIMNVMGEDNASNTVFGCPRGSSVDRAVRAIHRIGTLDVEVIVTEAKVTAETAEAAIAVYRGRGISLDTPATPGLDEGWSLTDRLRSNEPTPEEALEEAEDTARREEAARAALAAMSERERGVALACVMADDDDLVSLAEVGRQQKVSREYARQVLRRGCRRGRRAAEPLLAA